MKNSKLGWTGFDLDGTLAEYHGWTGNPYHIGKPIPAIVDIAKDLLAKGQPIKILTARACIYDPNTLVAIEEWCEEHLGQVVPITCQKDYNMERLYDDRAVQVETNTGRIIQDAKTD